MTPASRSAAPSSITAMSPAKLNLFLELLGRRGDGYHELDTVMIPIDLCDTMILRRVADQPTRLRIDWQPSLSAWQRGLGLTPSTDASPPLDIPDGPTNLICVALDRFARRFAIPGGFDVTLKKQIPAGAGMGGASSNAATALMAAAALCDVAVRHDQLHEIAAEIGSDVPFFLGTDASRDPGDPTEPSTEALAAAWATGRGERITAIPLAASLDLVVVYPGVSLSTASVYRRSTVPASPGSSRPIRAAMAGGDRIGIAAGMFNRLSDPARELAPRIDEILGSMWQVGLKACQLTGSGSACFAIAEDAVAARRAADELTERWTPGAMVWATRSIRAPASMRGDANDGT